MIKSTISVWYVESMCKYLSEKGFVHFATREPMSDDFKSGRAFMIDTEKKTFGLKDMIHRDDIDRANYLSVMFKKDGVISVLEKSDETTN